MKASGIVVIFLLVAGLFSLPAGAMVPESDRVLITDPAVLVSMGFAPDAQNVYMHKNAGSSAPALTVEPNDFGQIVHYTGLDSNKFQGRTSAWTYSCAACIGDIHRTGTEEFVEAQFDMPDGVAFQFVRGWFFDAHATEDMAVFVFERCLPAFSSGVLVQTTLASTDPITTGATGDQTGLVTLPVTTVDNQTCTYTARVRFGAPGSAATGSALRLHKLRAQWHRQISPAPFTATFLDVPTSHLFFQEVEALAASGITGGCGGGNYCPDGFVTRGQMAAFLSRALGLNWQ